MSTSRQEVAGGSAGGAAGVDPEASGETAAVAASRCWLALRFLPADFGALLAAGTCGAETVVLAEGEGSALAASNCGHDCPRCQRRSLRRFVVCTTEL